jgi:hypothetical protein
MHRVAHAMHRSVSTLPHGRAGLRYANWRYRSFQFDQTNPWLTNDTLLDFAAAPLPCEPGW